MEIFVIRNDDKTVFMDLLLIAAEQVSIIEKIFLPC